MANQSSSTANGGQNTEPPIQLEMPTLNLTQVPGEEAVRIQATFPAEAWGQVRYNGTLNEVSDPILDEGEKQSIELTQELPPGTHTIKARYWLNNLESIEIISPISIQAVTQPTPPEGVWFEQDFHYSSIDNLINEPHISKVSWNDDDASLSIQNVYYPNGDQHALRTTWNPAIPRRDQAMGIDINLPSAQNELWIEFYARWSSNFTTDGPVDDSAPSHKWLFLFDTSDARVPIYTGMWGTEIWLEDVPQQSQRYIPPGGLENSIFNGEAHRIRAHINRVTGLWEVWIDDFYMVSNNHYGDPINLISLGRNINQGVGNQNMWHEYGPVRVWISAPDW